MSRRKGPLAENAVIIDCQCGNKLAVMVADEAGQWTNVDPRAQPYPPRMRLNEYDTYEGSCRKCGFAPRVKRDQLQRAIRAVSAAGLSRMPFRGLPDTACSPAK